jgi:hypothetical protein
MNYPALASSFSRMYSRNRSFVISESETGCAVMRELSNLWKFGSFSVAGLAKPLNSLDDSSGPLIRNHNDNELANSDAHQE